MGGMVGEGAEAQESEDACERVWACVGQLASHLGLDLHFSIDL